MILLCRLYPWEASDTYYAPYELPRGQAATDLGQCSQQLQLQLLVQTVQRQCPAVQPLLLCHEQDDQDTAADFQSFRTVLQQAAQPAQPIVWLSNQTWLAQLPQELRTTLGYLASVPQNSALMQEHGCHYLIMRYSSANAPQTLEEV